MRPTWDPSSQVTGTSACGSLAYGRLTESGPSSQLRALGDSLLCLSLSHLSLRALCGHSSVFSQRLHAQCLRTLTLPWGFPTLQERKSSISKPLL